jgi:hypothetical protein
MSVVVFDAVIRGVNCILGLAGELSKAEERRRERVAAWIQELGEIIEDVANKLELNDYPHNTCAQMEIMVEHFPLIVGDLVHKKKIETIQEILRSSSQIEILFGEAQNADKEQRDDMINTLLRASGKLQGLASIIKHMD